VRLVIGAAIAFGLVSAVSALAPNYTFYAISGIAVGWATLTIITAANTTIQLAVEPAMRGRVMSIYMVVFIGSTPLGAPLVGWVSEAWGARWSIGVGAIASLAVGIAAALWTKSRWNVQVSFKGLPPHLVITHEQPEPPADDAA
jgi:MFS family permease